MYSTRTAGISSIVVVLIGAAAIGAGALMSGNESRSLSSVAMNASSTEASSSVAISVEEEGVKRTVRSEASISSQESSNDDNGGTAATNEEVSQPISVQTVTYTAGGFSPGQLTVPVGTTVQFENTSDAGMWVASDVHPTHEAYDGTTRDEHCPDPEGDNFDQCGAGEEFSFTFQTTGEFNYHNHQNSEHTGTIVVTEE